jgi:hypothetical protein
MNFKKLLPLAVVASLALPAMSSAITMPPSGPGPVELTSSQKSAIYGNTSQTATTSDTNTAVQSSASQGDNTKVNSKNCLRWFDDSVNSLNNQNSNDTVAVEAVPQECYNYKSVKEAQKKLKASSSNTGATSEAVAMTSSPVPDSDSTDYMQHGTLP